MKHNTYLPAVIKCFYFILFPPPPGTPDFKSLCPHGSGFTNSGDDINECSAGSSEAGLGPCSNGACENLIGSFRCICDPGWEADPRDGRVARVLEVVCRLITVSLWPSKIV